MWRMDKKYFMVKMNFFFFVNWLKWIILTKMYECKKTAFETATGVTNMLNTITSQAAVQAGR